MTDHTTEKDARLDVLVRDLRHPLLDVSASEAALVEYVRERMAEAWDEGYRQSTLAHGHIPEGSDPMRFGSPTTGPHANPYHLIPPAEETR